MPAVLAIRADYTQVVVSLKELNRFRDQLQPVVAGKAVAATIFAAETFMTLRANGQTLTVHCAENLCVLRVEPNAIALESICADREEIAHLLLFAAQYCKCNTLSFSPDVL